jgi:flagellar basal-body rod protein FlgG
MLDGLYSAASGMEAQQAQMDALSNDIANVDTVGYRSERVGFHDLLYTSGGASTGSQVATGAGAAADQIGRSQVEGAIQDTGQPLDVAIVGDGYLQVRRPDGTLGLTRNGALQLDAKGRLTTNQGMPLQPPITLPRGVTPAQLTIAPNGTVSSGARKLGTIAIVSVPATDKLLADGGSVFSATAASGAIRKVTGSTLKQGSLEQSNVDLAATMSQMITAQNNYAIASKAIQFQDQMLSIANGIKR